MFSLIVSSDPTAWETDQLMRMFADRFNTYSGAEAAGISLVKRYRSGLRLRASELPRVLRAIRRRSVATALLGSARPCHD